MFKLVIQDDGGKTTVVPLIRDEITIGRKEGNTIRLTERNVSRKHARIVRNNGAITIEDLNSYNGIKVNGNRIDGRCSISEVDRVQIGDYLLEVKREAKAAADAADDAETRPHVTVPMPEIAAPQNGAGVDPLAKTPLPNDSKPAPVAAAAAPEASPASPPRLVCLSTNFAGQEFVLTGPSMVIGRLDENEIPLNHRSISKTHAKLVQENGRWSIIDLQSSNGVRVNGEDYGKVELRPGDIVDLGHVRLRFVDAGEDFVFGRDAHAVDIGGDDQPRKMGWIIAVALLLGVAAAVYFVTRKDTQQGAAVANIDASIEVEPLAAIDAAGDVGIMDAGSIDPNQALAEIMSRATAAAEAKDWATAVAAANEILAKDPNHADAKALKKLAEEETQNQAIFDSFTKAVAANRMADVARTFEQIPASSVYKAEAEPAHQQAKQSYLERVVAAAQDLTAKNKCAELKKLARDVGAVKQWSDVQQAVLKVKCVRKTNAGDNTNTNNNNNTTNNNNANANPGDDDKTKKEKANALADQARLLGIKGSWGAARTRCEEALKLDPRNPIARSVCTLAGCNLRSKSLAERHFARLSAARKASVVSPCAKQGIILK